MAVLTTSSPPGDGCPHHQVFTGERRTMGAGGDYGTRGRRWERVETMVREADGSQRGDRLGTSSRCAHCSLPYSLSQPASLSLQPVTASQPVIAACHGAPLAACHTACHSLLACHCSLSRCAHCSLSYSLSQPASLSLWPVIQPVTACQPVIAACHTACHSLPACHCSLSRCAHCSLSYGAVLKCLNDILPPPPPPSPSLISGCCNNLFYN